MKSVLMCDFTFPVEQLLAVNLACAPVSSQEVTDLCSVQKACGKGNTFEKDLTDEQTDARNPGQMFQEIHRWSMLRVCSFKFVYM